MEPVAASAFSRLIEGHVAAIVAREVPLRTAALDVEVAGEEGLAATRRWYADFVAEFGAYSSSATVAQALETFRERRLGLLSGLADHVVLSLQSAQNAAVFSAYVDTTLIPDIDTADPTVGPVYLARMEHFERERLLTGYSELEKSLADAAGLISVPETYPEPTQEEIALATARAYGRYGKNRRDGTFSYGVFKESAADMRVRDVEKSQCVREPGGAYRCVVKIDLEIRMPGAINAALGSQDIRDLAMLYVQDQSNVASASFTEHLFVLTQRGWQSPTLMGGADAGISRGLGTVGQVVTGVGCALADLDC